MDVRGFFGGVIAAGLAAVGIVTGAVQLGYATITGDAEAQAEAEVSIDHASTDLQFRVIELGTEIEAGKATIERLRSDLEECRARIEARFEVDPLAPSDVSTGALCTAEGALCLAPSEDVSTGALWIEGRLEAIDAAVAEGAL